MVAAIVIPIRVYTMGPGMINLMTNAGMKVVKQTEK